MQRGYIQLGVGDCISHPEHHQALTEKLTTVASLKRTVQIGGPIARQQ